MKHVRLFLVVACLVGVGILGAHGVSIWPREAGDEIASIPTKTIDNDQSIGGQAEHDAKPNSERVHQDPQPNTQKTVAPETRTFEEVAPRQAEITQSTAVEYEYRALRTSNDPLPQPSWALNAIKTQSAWDSATGNGVIVAVIDSGFALAHEDLVDRWHRNNGEAGMTAAGGRCWTGTSVDKSTNNCDDDGNGYRDDWRGWDFVSVNNSPQAGDTDPNGLGVAHGTEVAGLVGAAGNNGVGTSTVSWNNTIMPLQALGDDGSGYTSSISAAIYYAVDNGASVINMSLGGDVNDATLAQAIKYAYNRGIVVVAAAGNCGTGSEEGCNPAKPGAMSYPALNEHVIAVGATTSGNVRASFSSYGPGIDVSAPGSGTLVSPMWRSDNQTSAYASSLYGTSFASPIVASYIGLIKSIRPSSSVDDVTAIVDASASKPAAMGADVYTVQLGHGIIDTSTGLSVATNLNQSPVTPELKQTGSHINEHTFSVQSVMGSGCTGSANSYCTVWARNVLGYDRFLPYTATGAYGVAGWTWQGNWLGDGEWSIRARSGTQQSTTPYILSTR